MLVFTLTRLLGFWLLAEDPMAEARSLEAAQNFAQAAQVYLQVAANAGPDRAEAFARAGQCYDKLNQPAQALSAYDQLLGFDEKSYWAEIALARKADLAFGREDRESAGKCIAKLEERFPDSPWTVCARITAAKLASGNVASAETAYARETQAFDAYREALRRTGTDNQLQGMEQIISQHPNTATATRAYESKAHLLWKKNLKEEAIAPWLAVLERTAALAPKAYIVSRAKMSLGGLYRKFGKHDQADAMFESVTSADVGPELAAKAAYCRIAIDFGQMRRDGLAGRSVTQQTADLVSRCRSLVTNEKAAKLDRVRAAMLPFEILWYGGQTAEAVQDAEAFIREYAGTEFKEEVAMAHFFVGWQMTREHRDPEALPHFREVLRLTPGQTLLFNTDAIPRSHYHLWRILRVTGAPREEVDAAAEAFFSAFPDSGYCKTIRTVREREEAQK